VFDRAQTAAVLMHKTGTLTGFASSKRVFLTGTTFTAHQHMQSLALERVESDYRLDHPVVTLKFKYGDLPKPDDHEAERLKMLTAASYMTSSVARPLFHP
jgi:hypothetical protein